MRLFHVKIETSDIWENPEGFVLCEDRAAAEKWGMDEARSHALPGILVELKDVIEIPLDKQWNYWNDNYGGM